MGKIVKFPKGVTVAAAATDEPDRQGAAQRPRAGLLGVLPRLLSLLRLPLFLVLYWLRFPVLMVCNFVSIPALLAFLAGLWLSHHAPQYRPMVWGVGGLSFAAFVLRWAYDSLLMWLAPADFVLAL
ncbi:hypothetical protein AAKU55_005536 [Oxalobacteraceae bacterium GrIS 1.11]